MIIDNIKMLAGVSDTSKDNIINYWIKDYTGKILQYCHLDALPSQLEPVVEQIVTKIIKEGITNPSQAGLKSMTRGDFSETYVDSAASKGMDPLLASFQHQLNLYRRLRT
jgi:hypothetical protein